MAPGCERSRQVVAGPGGCMQSRCGPCTGACAPSPVPRLLCPVSRLPSPAPRARARVHVLRVPRSAFCVPRPTPASSVFRVPHPHPHPRPRCPALCARGPAPRAPCPCPRLLRSADGSPCSAPCLPPALRGRSFRLLQAAGMKRKSGGSPEEPPDFACIAAARLTRACG